MAEVNASGRERGKLLVQAIYEAYEKEADERHSRRIGYSWIGDECERAIFYRWRWVTKPKKFEGRMLRLFESGNVEEPRMIGDLKRLGSEVYDRNPENAREQISASELDGLQYGYLDSIAGSVPYSLEDWLVVEYKTHSEKSFLKLQKEGVSRAKPEHYAQMQGYMREKGLKEALYFAKNKNTDELYCEFVLYDEIYAENLLKKAERVARAHTPPPKIHNDPGFFKCRFCDHSDVCHRGQTPQRNCRTCIHSTPLRDKVWQCEKHQIELDIPAQEKGCQAQRFLPGLVAHLEQSDVRGDDIVYKDVEGCEWIDNGLKIGKVKNDEQRASGIRAADECDALA